MSNFTSLTILRNHLSAFDFDAISIRAHPLQLEKTDSVQLPHNALASSGLAVHQFLANVPSGPQTIDLTGTSWHGTGHEGLLPGSVVVAADNLPNTRYQEGVDYAVADAAAAIKRLPGGSISDGETVYVWSLPLIEMVEDRDYTVDRDAGQIARIADGELPDPARVLVSYTTTPARASEALLTQAIDEAEGFILARLKDGYDESSTDAGLINGATELALSLVCDDLAGAVLARHGDSTVDDRSRRYLELAKRYEERALRNLSPFIRLPVPSPSSRQRNQPSSTPGW